MLTLVCISWLLEVNCFVKCSKLYFNSDLEYVVRAQEL